MTTVAAMLSDGMGGSAVEIRRTDHDGQVRMRLTFTHYGVYLSERDISAAELRRWGESLIEVAEGAAPVDDGPPAHPHPEPSFPRAPVGTPADPRVFFPLTRRR